MAEATPFQSELGDISESELDDVSKEIQRTFQRNSKLRGNDCRSFLAFRTEVAAASGNHDAFDRSLADEARLTFAAVDTVLQLEEAFFAIGVDVIGNG